MFLNKLKISMISLLLIFLAGTAFPVQYDRDEENSNNYDNYNRIRIDRYLDIEVWTNHSDGEYFEGDNIQIKFRVNRDAYVVLYSIDSRDHVNLIFPSEPGKENFVYGGITYTLPGEDDEYDLIVSGPEGAENIQAIASREQIPIPDWYPSSGIICDWDDRHEFMDYINGQYFTGYDGQRYSFDRTAIYINEWEEVYFRPVYSPVYPSWTVSGNVYFDYPFGSSIYIDGIYWGCSPLYIPRLYVGWHTFTVYDRHGYCWENDIHVTRYNTVVVNREIVKPRPTVRSKYKDVRFAGYREPVNNGYPDYEATKKKVINTTTYKNITKEVVREKSIGVKNSQRSETSDKKYVRGTTRIVKTDRGFESAGFKEDNRKYKTGYKGFSTRSSNNYGSGKSTRSKSSTDSYYKRESIRQSSEKVSGRKYKQESKSSGSSSDGYYQKKSGSTYKGSSGKKVTTTTNKKSTSGSSPKRTTVEKKKSDNSSSKSTSGSSYKTPKPAGSSKSNSKSGSTKKSTSKGKKR